MTTFDFQKNRKNDRLETFHTVGMMLVFASIAGLLVFSYFVTRGNVSSQFEYIGKNTIETHEALAISRS